MKNRSSNRPRQLIQLDREEFLQEYLYDETKEPEEYPFGAALYEKLAAMWESSPEPSHHPPELVEADYPHTRGIKAQ